MLLESVLNPPFIILRDAMEVNPVLQEFGVVAASSELLYHFILLLSEVRVMVVQGHLH